MTARQAVENDVHIVGVEFPGRWPSGTGAGAPRLSSTRSAGGDIMIVVGGVIPPAGFRRVEGAAGAAAIFPPGTVISAAASDLLAQLSKLDW